MIPNKIYTYWEGEMPPYIKFCLDLMKEKLGDTVTILSKDMIDNMDLGLNNNYKKLTNIAQKVDCIRIALLCKYGGMWCDADTIIIKDFKHLFETENDFTGFRWHHNRAICNGYFFAKQNSKFFRYCRYLINKDLKDNPKPYYGHATGVYFGEYLFNRVIDIKNIKITEYPLDTVLPVEFPFRGKIWEDKLEIGQFITENTVAIGLNNSHLNKYILNMPVENVASMDNLLGSTLRYVGVKPKEIIVNGLIESKKHLLRTLPDGFGPSHAQWNVPSYRNKWKQAYGIV